LITLTGTAASNGVALGRLLFQEKQLRALSPRAQGSAGEELARFHSACLDADSELEALCRAALERACKEEADIFKVQRILLADPDFLEPVKRAIQEDGWDAAYSVQQAAAQLADMIRNTPSDYMQARAADMQDAADRLIALLTGSRPVGSLPDGPSVIAARELTPSETVNLMHLGILGFATQLGSSLSHAAILARTLGLPAVTEIHSDLSLYHGRRVLLDGYRGLLFIDPDPKTEEDIMREERKRTAHIHALSHLPCQTRDGSRITLLANISTPRDTDGALSFGAEGIGLMRTEGLFWERCPGEEEQFAACRAVIERMGGRPVTFRSLDLGADKSTGWLQLPAERNPALGMRGLRLLLRRRELLMPQLRAVLRASAFGPARLMAPMVTSVKEMEAFRQAVRQAMEELSHAGLPFDSALPVGAMIETPASALIAGELAKVSDFFNVGTNDLTQYTLAVDRQSETLPELIDVAHPAVLRLIGMAAQGAERAGIPLCICGEAAADPQLCETFLGLGVRSLSVAPQAIPSLKEKIRTLTL
jgi:phosphotransferase system enzyme I (PtsI)